MQSAGSVADGRLGVSLRIGVTGHRWLDSSDQDLRDTVRDAVAALRAACSSTATPATAVGLTIVSSLAEGADRIAVKACSELGARVEVVLPLPVVDYLADFADDASRTEFQHLLEAADSVSTVPDTQRPVAYLAAGEAVVQRSDVVLALWDGSPARGPGGTAHIVDAAGAAKRPVAWIEVAKSGVGGRPRIRSTP